jgi:hypothetical protein
MREYAAPLLLAVLVAVAGPSQAGGEQKTVCTITVNSADEKEAFRRFLPPDKYRFVELVERGRPDWLASACRAGIRCDVLIISGHYDGGHEFFSDRAEAQEYLPVDEMERVACSDSCPALFSELKDVYLFGCNTLNPEARRSASAEIERSLVRSGHARADAQRLARMLAERHAESARDRMQQIFGNVPAIYGFSSVAPVGPVAGSILNRYFQSGGAGEVGSGRSSGRLQGAFTGHALAVTRGMSDTDPRAAHRRDICQFADDRLSPAQKLDFVHRLLEGEMAEVRLFLDRLETYLASLDPARRQDPPVARALDAIAQDRGARERYLAFARDADQPAVRVRMLDLAQGLGWLTVDERRNEIGRMIADDIARNAVDAAEVGLVCALDGAHEPLALEPMELSPAQAGRLANVAVLACLGRSDARARVLAALTSSNDGDAEIAQVYLRHRPIGNVDELRTLISEIALTTQPKAQARAVEALGRLNVSDRESLEALARLFSIAESPAVQVAIAGALLRADRDAIAAPELRQALLERRPRSTSGSDVIDALLRRIGAP